MTKGEMIESVLLAASGYRLSQDIPVRREDIATMLPEAIAYAVEKWNNMSLRTKFQEVQLFGASDHAFDFLTTIEGVLSFDEGRSLHYFELPSRVLSIRGTSAIQELFPATGIPYVKAKSRQEIAGIEDYGTFYWHEMVSGKSRLYVSGAGMPTCKHYARYLFNPADLGEDEEVPLPAGVGFEVVTLMTEFFINRRSPDENTDDKPKQP